RRTRAASGSCACLRPPKVSSISRSTIPMFASSPQRSTPTSTTTATSSPGWATPATVSTERNELGSIGVLQTLRQDLHACFDVRFGNEPVAESHPRRHRESGRHLGDRVDDYASRGRRTECLAEIEVDSRPEEGGDVEPGASGEQFQPPTQVLLDSPHQSLVTAPVALAGTPEMTGEIAPFDEVRHRFFLDRVPVPVTDQPGRSQPPSQRLGRDQETQP